MSFSARFPGQCRRCGNAIEINQKIDSATSGRGYQHVDCPRFSDRAEINDQNGTLNAASALSSLDADDAAYNAWLARPTQRLAVEDAGVYVLADGTIVKVQANREKTRTYAKRWVTITGVRLSEADTREHGEYQYESGLIAQVEREGRRMSLDEAKAFILRYGVCCRCGRGLKDATSVERGIGPVCVTYFSAGTSGADLLAAPAAQVEAFELAPADDDEEEALPLPKTIAVASAEKLLARKGFYTRSRWSRPGDDELEQAI